MALERRDPSCAPILKQRTCFVWEGNYFELDRYTSWTPVGGGHMTILEVELNDLDDPIELPPFIRIEREVTNERGWSNREIAQSLMGYGWEGEAELIGVPPMDRMALWERVKNEGKVSILFANHEVANEMVERLHDLLEGSNESFEASGHASKTLGLPYVLTITHLPDLG